MTGVDAVVVIGASGGLGAALLSALGNSGAYREVVAFSRSGTRRPASRQPSPFW